MIIIGEGGFCGLWSFILHGSLGREREAEVGISMNIYL